MADVEGRASPPPLLAYTASKQVQRQEKLSRRAGRPKDKAKEKGKAGGRNRAGVSKTYNSNVSATPRPRFRKPEAAIVFDDSSRREYLTGFHKRKQAKLEKGRERAKEREREERRQMRQETRESRKKQAAENVDAERKAYRADEGDDDDDGSEQDDDKSDDDGQVPPLPSAFDTEQHHTTVTVQEWEPDGTESFPKEASKRKPVKESLPPSSRRMAKKLKNSKGVAEAREISRLMEDDDAVQRAAEVELAQLAQESNDGATSHRSKGSASGLPSKKARKPKFHYESKLDRAKAKSQARETKAKWAEKRREERSTGGAKGRMQKNKGKRGHGGKGKKR